MSKHSRTKRTRRSQNAQRDALRKMAREKGLVNSASGSPIALNGIPHGSKLGMKGGYHIPD